MYDIDPPSPVLRLSDYRKGDGGTVFSPAPTSFAAQLDQYMAAKADRWAALHAPEKASGPDAMVFRACGAVERVKALAVADGDLAYAMDAL